MVVRWGRNRNNFPSIIGIKVNAIFQLRGRYGLCIRYKFMQVLQLRDATGILSEGD